VTTRSSSGDSDVRDYLRVLWRWRLTIIVVAILGVLLALMVSLLETKQYTATARVLIQPAETPPQLSPNNTTVRQPADIQTQVEFITSGPVQAAVNRQIGDAAVPTVSEVG